MRYISVSVFVSHFSFTVHHIKYLEQHKSKRSRYSLLCAMFQRAEHDYVALSTAAGVYEKLEFILSCLT